MARTRSNEGASRVGQDMCEPEYHQFGQPVCRDERLMKTAGNSGCPIDEEVFSNPGMSLKVVFKAGSFGRLLFGIFSYMSRGRRGGGNVEIGFIDFQGLWKGRKTAVSFSGLSLNRHFHGPVALLPVVHADLLICSNMLCFASCMRRAASVSLMVAATRLRALMLSPGRRNCCGRSSESSFSSGVCHFL